MKHSTGWAKRAILLPLCAFFAFAGVSNAGAEGPAAGPRFGGFGLDLTARDPKVKPGDDFYRFANGHWLDANQIPADRTRWGSFDVLGNEADERVRTLIQSLPAKAPAGSVEKKVGDFYRAYLDVEAIEAAGLRPARPALTAIANAKTPADIAVLMGRVDLSLSAPIGVGIGADDKNPDRYVAGIGQDGLGLPDRDYYLKQDAKFQQIRDQYRSHIEKMLTLAGDRDGARQAQDILDLEMRIAECHWPREKRRERDLTYNPRTLKQLEQLTPGFPWQELLGAMGLADREEFVVSEIGAVEELGKLFPTVPVATWQSYLRFHYLDSVAGLLPKAFDEEAFDFHGRKLNGQQQQRERWKRAVDAVGDALGEAVGQLYVKQYFPPAAKAQMQELVENLRKAYGERIQGLPWMTANTKKVAMEKLATFRPKIAYPDKWRDYSALAVRGNDAFGNRMRSRVFEWQRDLKRIDRPTDRDEWGMTPQTVNAYYNPTFNEIVFPAAILQAPFFDAKADPAVNYGAIGGVIGHEMGHGFDDQGAKSDAKGILRTWWAEEDTAAFKKLGDQLVKQYDAYEPLPGLHVNGRFTLGENIGDLGGLTVAYKAYRLSLKGKEAPVLDGLTGDQRFFLAWAQVWCVLMREEKLRNQVMSDTHSPPQFRVNGVVRNIDEWYSAFDVKPGDKLYLPVDQRVKIW